MNALRQTLEHDVEWLTNQADESMYTQTTADYVATDAIDALKTPGQTYGLNYQPFLGANSANVTNGAAPSQSILQ